MPKNKNLSKITNYLTADTDNGILSSNVSQTITGSLTVTGNLTAQQFIVSSSVTYLTQSFASGSNIFGNSSDDTHQFTGSMLLTGSLTVTTTGTEFQVNAGGVNIGNALTDSHILSGSLRVNPNGLFVSSSGNVGIGTISAVSKLTVDPGWVTNAGQWPSTAISIYNPTNIGAYSQISFGYTPSTTNSSAYIGYVSTNQGSNGYGDLVFGTRAVNTDTQPSERMRITSGGNFGFGTTSPSRQFVFSNGGAEGMEISASSGRVTIISYNRSTSSWLPLVLTEGSSNVLIGTTTDNGNKLQVNGTISGGNISTSGTMSGANLSVGSAVYTYNVTQAYYGQNFTFTPPNALNSGSDNSLMRMYMVWVWGANGATEAGARVWMIAINGGGTAHTVSQLLGRDANGATSLSLARTSASELTISSNNNAFIKYVSVMQLMTYANG
jgi:hypothetical protein